MSRRLRMASLLFVLVACDRGSAPRAPADPGPAVTVPIPRDLPGAMTATPELVLDVEIAADGAWMLDGEPIARDELPVRVAAARASHASQPVRAVLRASETTPHARVVEVMNSLRAVGVTQFAIDLRPDERAP